MPREKNNKKNNKKNEQTETKQEDGNERNKEQIEEQIKESTKLISNEKQNETPVSVFNVDQITMECFMNKNVYKKIIAKTNPVLFLENTRFQQQKKKYKTKILERTRQLLSLTFCEKNEVRSPIQEAFDLYVKQVIQELELKKYETNEMKRENDDEDVLFGNCVSEQVFSDDSDDDSDESNKNSEINEKCGMSLEKVFESSSFWSKDKVIKGK
jgi:predicted lactoylglutathione lyase